MNEKSNRWDKLLARFPGRAVAYSLILISVLAVLYKIGRDDVAKDDYSLNLYTEFLGVVVSVIVTVFIIDELNRRRDDRRRERDLKDRLLRDICSPNNATAIEAIHELQGLGWLEGEDGLLRGKRVVVSELHWNWGAPIGAKLKRANLRNANLEGSDLEFADLESAELELANLDNANLRGSNMFESRPWDSSMKQTDLSSANLEGAYLEYTNFENAILIGANLKRANLRRITAERARFESAELQGAIMWRAYLKDASFKNANMINVIFDEACVEGANFEGADLTNSWFNIEPFKINEDTILPDGSKWSLSVDMGRFTNPQHPCYWRSSDRRSPAHSSDEPDSN